MSSDHGLADVVLGSSRGRHAFEDCVERLATAIRLGVYPYGSALPPERELAIRMGVSRATLREGIAALRAAKMVRTRRGRGGGTVVAQEPATPGKFEPATPGKFEPATPGEYGPSGMAARRAELLDSLVFRRVVEPGACQLAASQPLSEEKQLMLRQTWRAAAEATDPAEHRQADSRLHLAIAALTDSPQLVDAVTGAQADLHTMLIAIPVLEVNMEHSRAQHASIVEAILAGHGLRARREMENHCDDTAALLRGLLR